MNLEEMGIVSSEWIHISGEGIQVEFRPTSHVCPVGLAIGVIIKDALERGLRTDVEVRMLRGSHSQEGMVNDLLNDWVTQELDFTARYVRVEVFGNPDGSGTQARELEIFGSPSTSTQTPPRPRNLRILSP